MKAETAERLKQRYLIKRTRENTKREQIREAIYQERIRCSKIAERVAYRELCKINFADKRYWKTSLRIVSQMVGSAIHAELDRLASRNEIKELKRVMSLQSPK